MVRVILELMRTIDAAEFKEQCLSLLDNLEGEGIVITCHGEPVAKVTPISSDCAGLIGSMKGKIKIKGDILSTGLRWRAAQRFGGRCRSPSPEDPRK